MRYCCVVGHQIPADQLDEATEVRVLDRGAKVRLCIEHGAPIAMTREPGDEPASYDPGEWGSGPRSSKPEPFHA
jgi:hypothetical protein